MQVVKLTDSAALAQEAAARFITLARKAIGAQGVFRAALAGGSTPGAMYAILAEADAAGKIDWPHVGLFWGDERCVAPDHPDSNYRMARESLIDHVPIVDQNVHRMRGEWEPERAAASYEQTLRAVFHPDSIPKKRSTADSAPAFDLILLGMGSDGHTASLFPGTAAIRETKRWVVAHFIAGLNAWRLTLTPIVLNAAREVHFLVSGEQKAESLRRVLRGPYDPDRLPAQIVRPKSGRLTWLVDEAAGALLADNGPSS